MELSVVCSTYGGQLSILKLFSYKPVGTIYIYKLKGHFLRIETNLSSCVNLLDTEVVLPPPPSVIIISMTKIFTLKVFIVASLTLLFGIGTTPVKCVYNNRLSV